MNTVLDHLVIGATSLAAGTAWLRGQLGVELPYGGTHGRMGTHNAVMRLSDGRTPPSTPAPYLEVIAIDPAAASPGRRRWFGLDDPARQRQLASGPRPIAWVARTDDLSGALAAAGGELGDAHEMTRGVLTWRIGVRDDGMMPEGGTLPALIEWPRDVHPTTSMADFGVTFDGLRLLHPEPAKLIRSLGAVGAADAIDVVTRAEPAIEIRLRRPDGRLVTLR